eukprot:79982_1
MVKKSAILRAEIMVMEFICSCCCSFIWLGLWFGYVESYSGFSGGYMVGSYGCGYADETYGKPDEEIYGKPAEETYGKLGKETYGDKIYGDETYGKRSERTYGDETCRKRGEGRYGKHCGGCNDGSYDGYRESNIGERTYRKCSGDTKDVS